MFYTRDQISNVGCNPIEQLAPTAERYFRIFFSNKTFAELANTPPYEVTRVIRS